MTRPRSFFRVFTDAGPLIAVAVALLLGVVGPASAQFFNFGGFGGPPRSQPRGGGWFGGDLFTPFQQQQQPRRERVIREVSAGGMVVNHLGFQVTTTKLPFGGVGPSGMGAYHGRFGFEEFSHRKTVMTKPTRPDVSAMIYPPYTERAWKLARRLF